LYGGVSLHRDDLHTTIGTVPPKSGHLAIDMKRKRREECHIQGVERQSRKVVDNVDCIESEEIVL